MVLLAFKVVLFAQRWSLSWSFGQTVQIVLPCAKQAIDTICLRNGRSHGVLYQNHLTTMITANLIDLIARDSLQDLSLVVLTRLNWNVSRSCDSFFLRPIIAFRNVRTAGVVSESLSLIGIHRVFESYLRNAIIWNSYLK